MRTISIDTKARWGKEGGCITAVWKANRIAGLVFAIAFATPSLVSAREVDNKALEQASKAWKLADCLGEHHLSVSFSYKRVGDKEDPVTGTVLFDGNRVRATFGDKDRPTIKGYASCKNDRYAFILTRATPKVPYVVRYLGQPNKSFEDHLSVELNSYYGCRRPWIVRGRLLSEWLSEPGVVVKEAGLKNNGGKVYLSLTFSYTPPAGKDRRKTITKALVHCDPANAYCIDYSVVTDLVATATTKFSYRPLDSGFPVLASFNESIVFTSGEREESIGSYEWEYRKSSIPDEEFMISKFSIPEPRPAVPTQRSLIWLWLLIASACLGIASIWLWTRVRIRPTS